MKKIRNSRKGFTLVEIVLVIAVVVILSSVSVVGIAATIQKAENAQDKVSSHEDFEEAAWYEVNHITFWEDNMGMAPVHTPDPEAVKNEQDKAVQDEIDELLAQGYSEEDLIIEYDGEYKTSVRLQDGAQPKTQSSGGSSNGGTTNSGTSNSGTTTGDTTNNGTTNNGTTNSGTTNSGTNGNTTNDSTTNSGTTTGDTTNNGTNNTGTTNTTQSSGTNAAGSSVTYVPNDNNGWHSSITFDTPVTSVVIQTDSKDVPSVNDNGKYGVKPVAGTPNTYEIYWQADGWGQPKSTKLPFNVSNDTTYVTVVSYT
jgi:prepilin-type N-terminal cleavage/methylation domain-containing protein